MITISGNKTTAKELAKCILSDYISDNWLWDTEKFIEESELMTVKERQKVCDQLSKISKRLEKILR